MVLLGRYDVDDTAPTAVPPEARREASPVHAPTTPVAAGEKAPQQPEADFGSDPQPLPGTFADPDLAKMFAGQEAKAHAALVGFKWLAADQPLSALPAERVDTIKKRPGAFAARAGITIATEGAA